MYLRDQTASCLRCSKVTFELQKTHDRGVELLENNIPLSQHYWCKKGWPVIFLKSSSLSGPFRPPTNNLHQVVEAVKTQLQ